MLTLLNVFLGCSFFFLLTLAYIIFKFIIKPYSIMGYYKKQGLQTYFFPVIGEVKDRFADVDEHGDYYYGHKQMNFMKPKPRAWVTILTDVPIVLLKDPELIKNYFLHQDRYYVKLGSVLVFLKYISGEGILFAEGAVYKRHRKIVSAAFNYEFLKEMIPDLVSFSDDLLERFKSKDLNNFDILAQIQVITGELIGRIFFGEDLSNYDYKGRPLTQCLAEFLAKTTLTNLEPINLFLHPRLVKMGVLPAHRELINKVKEFKVIMRQITMQKIDEVAEAVKNPQATKSTRRRVNLIEVFGKQRVLNLEYSLTIDEIVDECITFLQAGTDSTGHLLCMATYFFQANPRCRDKIFKEVNEVFRNPSDVTIEKLGQMDYMTAFLKECLRMTPPASILFPRVALEDHDLGGLKIKKGTAVNISFISNYFDPEYHQEPETFMPERWIDENSRTKKSVNENPCLFTPFSGGSRNCIGQHLGMIEAKIIFSLFLLKFDYCLTDKDYKLKMTERALHEPLDPIMYKMTVKKA